MTQWRRSYDIPPPPMEPSHEHWPGKDRRYASLSSAQLPLTESLATTGDRFLPFWHKELVPLIQSGKRILVVAHGNSLRALVKHLDDISRDEITGLNIPTGVVRRRRKQRHGGRGDKANQPPSSSLTCSRSCTSSTRR